MEKYAFLRKNLEGACQPNADEKEFCLDLSDPDQWAGLRKAYRRIELYLQERCTINNSRLTQ